jgi:hypothetical protein
LDFFRHLEKWNADRDCFLADGGGRKMQELGELLCDGVRGKRTLTQAPVPPFNSSSTFPPKLARPTPIALTILV